MAEQQNNKILSRRGQPTTVELPVDLWTRLKQDALAKRTTLKGVIISRLRTSFSEQEHGDDFTKGFICGEQVNPASHEETNG